MKRLIIHIGPGKCGSSSIQNFFRVHKNPCIQKTNFTLLNPQKIQTLNRAEQISDVDFSNSIDENFKLCDILILSHEYLFQCPHAIKNICHLSSEKAAELIIIGYSRPQSGFLISAYSQWLFRSKQRVEEAKKVIIDHDINPLVFTGLERQIIASILDDFHSARQLSNHLIMDWNKSYTAVEKSVSGFDVKIKAGVLPKKNSSTNLIEDFCKKSNLTIKEDFKSLTNVRTNTKFNDAIVEAINNAIEFDLQVPGPHNGNQLIRKISQRIQSNKKPQPGINKFLKQNNNFLNHLKQYIDSYFLSSNIEFCNKYEINKNHFHSPAKYSKDQIIRIIKKEEQQRISNNSMVNFYKELTGLMAETCLQLIKDNNK